MVLANKINVPLTSISDIKKAPMKVFTLSKDKKSAVYVLNKNKEVGVMLDIDEYNKMYDHQFSLSTAGTLKKDISNRLAHKKPYTNIQDKDKLGLLIVVDQMLTGFDSKWLNVLYMDKVIKYESVIQAISRTNRIYNKNIC